jgi:hypothetical protein
MEMLYIGYDFNMASVQENFCYMLHKRRKLRIQQLNTTVASQQALQEAPFEIFLNTPKIS